jgi:TolB protein
MTENSNPEAQFIDIQLSSTEYTVAPGNRIEIPLYISNQSLESHQYKINVTGIQTGWISASQPVIEISPGEQKKVTLYISPPPPPETTIGLYPLTITVSSLEKPEQTASVLIMLHIAAFEIQGRIGVMLDSTQFSVAPGSSTPVKILYHNQGLVDDVFILSVEGIPPNWISTASLQTSIAVGEKKEISLVIKPPKEPQTKAGPHKFTIKVTSQADPNQSVEIQCRLTVAVFTHFTSELEPVEVTDNEIAEVKITNLSNIPQTYNLSWASRENTLQFFPADNQQIQVQPGKNRNVEFGAKPRQRPIFGGEVTYPFSVSISSAEKKTQTLNGDFLTKAIIPYWVIPVVLIFCLSIVCLGIYFVTKSPAGSNSATQTAQAQQTSISLILGATQTAIALQPVTPPIVSTITITPGDIDSDNDGLPDSNERDIGTDPFNPDTDGDGLQDGEEVLTYTTNPLTPDTDNDGLSDGEEVLTYKTNPLLPDSDADGLGDGDEVQRGTNPLVPDTDGDSLLDGDEIIRGTNPLNPDSDNDQLTDGIEARSCPNPLDPDTDKDTIIDGSDLDPCDPNNPSLTATAAVSQPTNTPIPPTQPPPTAAPTNTPLPTSPPVILSGKIVYASNQTGNFDIYLYDTSNKTTIRLTNDPANDVQPSLSPNGKWIAFVSNRTGNNEIFVMNVDGTGQTNITNDLNDDQAPSWAPDSDSIAFQTNREGNYEIYSMTKDGGNLINLTKFPGADDVQPDWFEGKLILFATSQSIAFSTNRDGNQEIYIMEANGANQTNLTNNPSSDDSQPAAAHVGDQITFTTTRTGNLEVFIMNVDGSGQQNLTNNPAQDQQSTWSPDNRYIAFTSNRNGKDNIYVMNRDGSNPFSISNSPAQDRFPSWR